MTQSQRLCEAGQKLIEAVERITRRNGLGQKLDLALAVNEFRKTLAASQPAPERDPTNPFAPMEKPGRTEPAPAVDTEDLVEWAEVGMNLFADLLQEVGDVEVELIDGEGPDAIRENYRRVIRAALATTQPAVDTGQAVAWRVQGVAGWFVTDSRDEAAKGRAQGYEVRPLMEANPAPLDAERLREAADTCAFWLEGALKCKNWHWDADQHEAATWSLNELRTALRQKEGGQ